MQMVRAYSFDQEGIVSEAFDRALNCLDVGAHAFFSSRPRYRIRMSQYESTVAAFAIAHLVASNVRGVSVLGSHGSQNLPAAAACARSAFEGATTIAWMLDSTDIWDREARWLAYLKADQQLYERLARDLGERAPELASNLDATASKKAERRQAIADELEEKGARKYSFPDMQTRLAAIGNGDLYVGYRQASDITHAGPDALSLVRHIPSGGQFEFGALYGEPDWTAQLRQSWWSLHRVMPLVIRTVGGQTSIVAQYEELASVIDSAIDAL